MKILIDADGCPVVRAAVDIAGLYHCDCILVCDTSHYFDFPNATVIIVPQGNDSADYKIANSVCAQDIVITQDYGLAAMCLAKRAIVLDQNGRVYNEQNIDSLLQSRHIAGKIRKSGGRLKGNPKRRKEQDASFAEALDALLRTHFKK